MSRDPGPSAHRVIRQIIRGDYAHFQREAEEGRKRQRMYLVATDISPEAEYALEWTIGTVLRDGDTLFAVYAADEEASGVGGGEGGVAIGHGAENVRDTARIIRDLPATTNAVPQSAGPSPLAQSAVPGEAAGLGQCGRWRCGAQVRESALRYFSCTVSASVMSTARSHWRVPTQ